MQQMQLRIRTPVGRLSILSPSAQTWDDNMCGCEQAARTSLPVCT